MRAVVQRVSRARVTVDASVTGEITTGLLILLGVGRNDTSAIAVGMAERIANLRIFEDEQRKMNRSLPINCRPENRRPCVPWRDCFPAPASHRR